MKNVSIYQNSWIKISLFQSSINILTHSYSIWLLLLKLFIWQRGCRHFLLMHFSLHMQPVKLRGSYFYNFLDQTLFIEAQKWILTMVTNGNKIFKCKLWDSLCACFPAFLTCERNWLTQDDLLAVIKTWVIQLDKIVLRSWFFQLGIFCFFFLPPPPLAFLFGTLMLSWQKRFLFFLND